VTTLRSVRFDNTAGYCVTTNCGVTSLRITYCGGWNDDTGIDIYTDHGESYTCTKSEREGERERERKKERQRERVRERESVVDLSLFIFRLLCITSTHRTSLIFRD